MQNTRSLLPRFIRRAVIAASFVAIGCSSPQPIDGIIIPDLARHGVDGGFDASGQQQDGGGGVDLATAAADAAMVVTSHDSFSASRTACINEINRLRAMQSLAPYTILNTDSINTCIDAQATSDEMNNSPHQAWGNGSGACDGNGQNECEGYGTDPAGIVACLDDMWAEQNQPNCTGCAGCTQFGGNCANCDFYGAQGGECGHYVNMSATYFTQVACGFSTLPSGGWAAQNFFQ